MKKRLLKIKEDVDLSILTNYGFKQITYYPSEIEFFKKVYLENDEDDRVCYHIKENDRLLKITRLDGEVLDDTLLTLMKEDILTLED